MARKPISIWIGQILIALVGLAFAGALIDASILQWPIIIRAAAKNQTILVIAGLELDTVLALRIGGGEGFSLVELAVAVRVLEHPSPRHRHAVRAAVGQAELVRHAPGGDHAVDEPERDR